VKRELTIIVFSIATFPFFVYFDLLYLQCYNAF